LVELQPHRVSKLVHANGVAHDRPKTIVHVEPRNAAELRLVAVTTCHSLSGGTAQHPTVVPCHDVCQNSATHTHTHTHTHHVAGGGAETSLTSHGVRPARVCEAVALTAHATRARRGAPSGRAIAALRPTGALFTLKVRKCSPH
jgi:hypothetical protein